jgi:hypothetical protein
MSESASKIRTTLHASKEELSRCVPNVGRAHWQRKQALAYGFCRTHKAYTKFLPSNEQKAGSLHSIQEAGQFMSGTYCIASQVCRGSKSDVAIKEVESVHFSTATWRFPPSGHQTSFFNPTPRLSRDLRILRVDLAIGVRLVWQAHAFPALPLHKTVAAALGQGTMCGRWYRDNIETTDTV